MSGYIGLHERITKTRDNNVKLNTGYFKYIGLILIIAILSVLIFYSGIWRNEKNIKTIELTGNTKLTKDEIFSFARINDSLIKSNSLLLQVIEERIAKHPEIQSVNVSNESGNFVIEIAEKSPFAIIIKENRQPLMVDDKLNIFYYRKESKPVNVPIITGMSDGIDINNISREDFAKLKIAQYIISRSSSINKSMYNYIAEISFLDTTCLMLYGGDRGTAVYLLDYEMLKDIHNFLNNDQKRKFTVFQSMNMHQLVNIKNELFISELNDKLMMLNNFLKKILPYRGPDAFKYIDLRYKGNIIVKSN